MTCYHCVYDASTSTLTTTYHIRVLLIFLKLSSCGGKADFKIDIQLLGCIKYQYIKTQSICITLYMYKGNLKSGLYITASTLRILAWGDVILIFLCDTCYINIGMYSFVKDFTYFLFLKYHRCQYLSITCILFFLTAFCHSIHTLHCTSYILPFITKK